MANEGLPVINLTPVTSVPTSINLVVTQRINGVEKPARLIGIDLTNLGGNERISTASAAASQAVSVAASVNNKLTATSATLDARVTSVLAVVATNKNLIDINIADIVSINGDLSDALIRVDAISAQVSNISVIAAGVTSIADRLSAVSALGTSVATLTSTLENRVSNVSIATASVNTRVENVSGNVTSVNVRVAGVSSNLTSVNSRVDSVSGNTTSVNTRVNTVSGNTTSVNTRVGLVSGAVTSTVLRLATVSTKQTSINNRVSNVSTGYVSADNVVFNDLASVNQRASVNEANIVALTARVSNVSIIAANASGGGGAAEVTSAQYASLVSVVERLSTALVSVNSVNFGEVTVLSGASVNISAKYEGWTVLVNHNAIANAIFQAGSWGQNREIRVIQQGAGAVSIISQTSTTPGGQGTVYYPVRFNKIIPPGFPFPIHHSMLPSGWSTRVQSNGGDLRLFASVSDTQLKTGLPFDIARIDTTTSVLAAFGVASVTIPVGQKVYLQTNASASTQVSAADPLGSQNVWYKYLFVTHDFTDDRTGNNATSITGTTPVSDVSILDLFNGYPVRAFGANVGVSSTDVVKTNISAVNTMSKFSHTTFIKPATSALAANIIFDKGRQTYIDVAFTNRFTFRARDASPDQSNDWSFEEQPQNWVADGLPRPITLAYEFGSGIDPVFYTSGSAQTFLFDASVRGSAQVTTNDVWRLFNGRPIDSGSLAWNGYAAGYRMQLSVVTAEWAELEAETYSNPTSIAIASAVVSNTAGPGAAVDLSIVSRGNLFRTNGQNAVARVLFSDTSTAYVYGDLT